MLYISDGCKTFKKLKEISNKFRSAKKCIDYVLFKNQYQTVSQDQTAKNNVFTLLSSLHVCERLLVVTIFSATGLFLSTDRPHGFWLGHHEQRKCSLWFQPQVFSVADV